MSDWLSFVTEFNYQNSDLVFDIKAIFPARLSNALVRGGRRHFFENDTVKVKSTRDFLTLVSSGVIRIRNVGDKSMALIDKALSEMETSDKPHMITSVSLPSVAMKQNKRYKSLWYNKTMVSVYTDKICTGDR